MMKLQSPEDGLQKANLTFFFKFFHAGCIKEIHRKFSHHYKDYNFKETGINSLWFIYTHHEHECLWWKGCTAYNFTALKNNQGLGLNVFCLD